jgi:hypothetical protein
MLGVGEAVEQRRSVQSVIIITMSEQAVHASVAQRIIIKFLSGEGVKPAQIFRRFTEQFKEETLSRARVFAWHKHFVEGREHVENEGHDRRPRTSVTAGQLATVFYRLFARTSDTKRCILLRGFGRS